MDDKSFIKELIDLKSKSLHLDGSQDIIVILNLNLIIEFATDSFKDMFIDDLNTCNKSFTSLTKFQAQTLKIEALINHSITSNSLNKFIYFIVHDGSLQAKLFEIRPILNTTTKLVAAVSIIATPYKEYGLVFHGLKQNNIIHTDLLLKTSFSKRKQEKHVGLLTDFQLTICYLIVHNYSNERIAQIINQMDLTRQQKTTKNSINKQIEFIRNLYTLPSKESLIEFLSLLNVQSFLPKSIFNEKIILLH